jgi:hypothetical protein
MKNGRLPTKYPVFSAELHLIVLPAERSYKKALLCAGLLDLVQEPEEPIWLLS